MEKNKCITALRAAFPYTVPVMFGYVFLGAAFGMLLSQNGYGLPWAAGMSGFVYAGSMQFVCIELFNMPFSVLQTVMMTLMVNARHIFYGISMLERYEDTGRFKPYLILGMSDETYCIVCSAKPPEGADRRLFYFFITLLNQLYWIAGSVLGSLAGEMVKVNAEGIDFAMTALFIVIFVSQWEEAESHLPALAGLIITAVCLAVFGTDNFLIFSMLGILIALIGARPFIAGKGGKE